MMTGKKWAAIVTVIATMLAAAITQAESLGLTQQHVAIIGVMMAGITAFRELVPVFTSPEE